jgi:hypothetical protein
LLTQGRDLLEADEEHGPPLDLVGAKLGGVDVEVVQEAVVLDRLRDREERTLTCLAGRIALALKVGSGS